MLEREMPKAWPGFHTAKDTWAEKVEGPGRSHFERVNSSKLEMVDVANVIGPQTETEGKDHGGVYSTEVV